MLNSETWIENIGDRNVRTLQDAQNYLLAGPLLSYQVNGFGLWLVAIKGGTPIGMCGLIKRKGLQHIDIGFALLPAYTGKGYAYEITSATLRYAKEQLGVNDVCAITAKNNHRASTLLQKLGMHSHGMISVPGIEEELMLFEMDDENSKI